MPKQEELEETPEEGGLSLHAQGHVRAAGARRGPHAQRTVHSQVEPHQLCQVLWSDPDTVTFHQGVRLPELPPGGPLRTQTGDMHSQLRGLGLSSRCWQGSPLPKLSPRLGDGRLHHHIIFLLCLSVSQPPLPIRTPVSWE